MFSRWPRYLQPRAGRGDVVGGALALGLHQHGQVEVVLAVPRRERLEQLQPVAGGATTTSTAGAVGRRGEEAGLAGRRSPRRAAPRRRAGSSCTSSPSALVSVSVIGVEVERAGQGQGDDGLGRGDEGERVGVAVVALREVAVVGGDDRRWRRPRARRRGAHWPMHGPQALASTVAPMRLEVGEQAVALDGGPHLLGAGRDQQRGLAREARWPTACAGDRRRRG